MLLSPPPLFGRGTSNFPSNTIFPSFFSTGAITPPSLRRRSLDANVGFFSSRVFACAVIGWIFFHLANRLPVPAPTPFRKFFVSFFSTPAPGCSFPKSFFLNSLLTRSVFLPFCPLGHASRSLTAFFFDCQRLVIPSHPPSFLTALCIRHL